MKEIKNFFINNVSEIILIAGLLFIIYATFLLNYVAGLYVTGLILDLLGIFVAKK